jgi:hypothetical protein
MSISYSSTNPLTITVTDNTVVRAVFRQVQTNEVGGVEQFTQSELAWRDCVDGVSRTGTPPAGYIQVEYTGAGGGTCWEPQAIIGFEPDLDQVLTFNWRRGTTAYPEAKSFKMTNPSSTLSFDVTITTNSQVTVTPPSFKIAPRSYQNVTVLPTPSLFSALGDGISNVGFKIEITEVI